MSWQNVGSFPDELLSEWLPDQGHSDRRRIRLLADFRFIRPNGHVIVVPKGFVSDGSSVPQAAWTFEPSFGDCLEAAIIHDYLYNTRGLGGAYSRAECDHVFLEGMTALGVPWGERHIMWAAVRGFGWTGFGH